MGIKPYTIYDIDELATEVLNILLASDSVDPTDLTNKVVCDAIFLWIDQFYIRSKMIWSPVPPDSLDTWCKALGADMTNDHVDTGYNEAEEHLGAELEEMFSGLIGLSTWAVLTVARVNEQAFALQIGEDYRISWYMTNVHRAGSKKKSVSNKLRTNE
jgi:hypothetical protein